MKNYALIGTMMYCIIFGLLVTIWQDNFAAGIAASMLMTSLEMK